MSFSKNLKNCIKKSTHMTGMKELLSEVYDQNTISSLALGGFGDGGWWMTGEQIYVLKNQSSLKRSVCIISISIQTSSWMQVTMYLKVFRSFYTHTHTLHGEKTHRLIDFWMKWLNSLCQGTVEGGGGGCGWGTCVSQVNNNERQMLMVLINFNMNESGIKQSCDVSVAIVWCTAPEQVLLSFTAF